MFINVFPKRKMPSSDDRNALTVTEYSDPEDNICHYNGSVFCNPASRVHRYFVLIFMCLLAFGEFKICSSYDLGN